ncbi:MAG TPA: hypothetical protein PKX76_07735, partial [Flexilinea sp.]|nr:hypothetical protein [Flexilinea sp.]
AVGEKTKKMVSSALKGGMDPQRVKWFATVQETIEYTRQRGFKKGEVVLIKGSRGMQMERIVEAMERII